MTKLDFFAKIVNGLRLITVFAEKLDLRCLKEF